jgi:hypothetical protein
MIAAVASWVERLAQWVRLKALALLVAAFACAFTGIAYLVPSAPTRLDSLTYVERWVPLSWAAWVWVAAGALCLFAIAFHAARPWAFGAAIALHTAWAVSFMGSYLFLDSARGWVSARAYLVIALLILIAAGIKEGPRPWETRFSLP